MMTVHDHGTGAQTMGDIVQVLIVPFLRTPESGAISSFGDRIERVKGRVAYGYFSIVKTVV